MLVVETCHGTSVQWLVVGCWWLVVNGYYSPPPHLPITPSPHHPITPSPHHPITPLPLIPTPCRSRGPRVPHHPITPSPRSPNLISSR
ncbi:hypothetical protein [Fischerella sp. FACHB-380]|uniref:hypothetical protein n=1 Tax=Fischerella sp. FACHB-380 TaxID=2692799 RepID=UPI0019AAA4EF|nr:hypothetical protein [Fischerella sp. FACHB-380]